MYAMVKTALFAALMVAAPAAFAADLVVTQAETASKSGRTSFSLDIASDGDVSGFNFVLRSNVEMKPGSIDLSKCVADLPKSFTGECRQNKDGIYVFAMASGKSVLPAGVVSIGRVALPAAYAAKGVLSVQQLEMINAEAEVISSGSQLAQ